MIDLRSDESPFHVGMDLPGRLGSLRALADRPGTGLDLAGCEERDEVQELIGCADQPDQASFAHAKFPEVVRPLFGRQSRHFRFDAAAPAPAGPPASARFRSARCRAPAPSLLPRASRRDFRKRAPRAPARPLPGPGSGTDCPVPRRGLSPAPAPRCREIRWPSVLFSWT